MYCGSDIQKSELKDRPICVSCFEQLLIMREELKKGTVFLAPDQITDTIWLGGENATLNEGFFKEKNIKGVLTISDSSKI